LSIGSQGGLRTKSWGKRTGSTKWGENRGGSRKKFLGVGLKGKGKIRQLKKRGEKVGEGQERSEVISSGRGNWG